MVSRDEKKLKRQPAKVSRKAMVAAKSPLTTKAVDAAGAAPEGIDDKPFAWSATSIDHQYVGSWDWDLQPSETADVLVMLEHMSQLTWREVKSLQTHSKRKTRRLNHSQGIETVCVEAQERLVELQLDLDEIFRLRHGNLTRIWGYLQGPILKLLWFDRQHLVYPVAD